MAFIERFSSISKGDLVFVGNTLGLSKNENQNTSGKIGSIGAFTSTNEQEQVATFPKGTTLDCKNNSSSAFLQLPKDSQILYAELIWSGIYKSRTKDISNALKQSISMTTSKGKNVVNADYATKQDKNITVNGVTLGIYTRTSNVTEIVKKSMSGNYIVSGIPTIIEPNDNETLKTNFAGWTLAIAYKNDRMPVKTMNLKVGCEPIYNGNFIVEMKGFDIAKRNINKSKLYFSTGEGDAELSGDSVYFGKDENSLVLLSGPNNKEDNFFASQINNSEGVIDESGSFGQQNHDAKNNANIVAGRQGWDITTINIKQHLKENWTKSVVKFNSTQDLFVPNAVGMSISSSGANLRVTKCADKTKLVQGDTVTYTIEIENVGDLVAQSIVLFDSVPPFVTFDENSIKVDGVAYRGKFPIPLSDLNQNEKHIVTFKIKIKQYSNKVCKNTARVSYDYILSSGKKVKEDSNSNVVCLRPDGEKDILTITKSVDKKISTQGDILTYTNVIKNISSDKITDVSFFDNIPNGTTFVEQSVVIDGVQYFAYDAVAGFILGDLNPNESVSIEFKVQVD